MKYLLILWVCSSINASCIVPPITTPEVYNSHNECISAGYVQGYNVTIYFIVLIYRGLYGSVYLFLISEQLCHFEKLLLVDVLSY